MMSATRLIIIPKSCGAETSALPSEKEWKEAFSVIRRANASEAIDGTRVRMKEIGKPRYEFEEFVNQVLDKVIDEIEQV